jgi:hypothetical protein
VPPSLLLRARVYARRFDDANSCPGWYSESTLTTAATRIDPSIEAIGPVVEKRAYLVKADVDWYTRTAVAETTAAWTTRGTSTGCLPENEGSAYAVLLRGRGTDGRDVTGRRLCLYTAASLGKPEAREGEGRYRWCSFHISITRRMLTSAGLV